MALRRHARPLAVMALGLALQACAAASHERVAATAGDRGRPAGPATSRSRPAAPADAAGAPAIETARARPPDAFVPPPAMGRDDDGPLTAKIDAATPAKRAAALRLTEQARGFIAGGEAPRAIELLERAVAVDARVPYAYYFLAEAHHVAAHPVLARSFLARAEQLFGADRYWLGRVYALRGLLAEEEGHPDQARDAYGRALTAWPRNGVAATGLARLDARGQGAR